MCGIVGSLAFDNNGVEVRPKLLERMRDAMQHRGPDGAGLWISRDRKIGLGHRRLAIIDVSSVANQPMSNEDESLWIVFNGEIYNHAAIRSELEKTGRYRWKTDHSDTEVILHAFAEWGIACLDKFRGMFAFGLWDARRRELWLVRDRIGVKPIYYSVNKGHVSFASEIKALLEDPDQQRSLNVEALYHYLSFLTTPAPVTLFQGIRKLSPGTWMCFRSDGSVEQRKYWDVWDHTQPLEDVPDKEVAEHLLQILRESVQLRKVSDVPVGVFLSGGIDSSTNAALFSENDSNPVRTFSIGYQGDYESYQNELEYARQVAKLVGAEHHERLLTESDLIEFLPRMIRLQDEPIADPVCVPLFYVSQLARQNGVVVCQVGEGSDELFCGYRSWKIKHTLQQMNGWPVPGSVKRMALQVLRSAGKAESFPWEFLRRGSEDMPIFWGGAEVFTEEGKQQLLSDDTRRSLAGLTSWEVVQSIYGQFQSKAWEKSVLNWMSYLDLNLRLPELLLMRVDKMSMGVSLEGRVPFLDHKFVEFALSIPASQRYKNGELKSILKLAVRGLIPDSIIDRKKQGFGVPVFEWLKGHLGELSMSVIDHFARSSGILNPTAVDRIFQARNPSQTWCLLNLALWWKHYMEGESLEDLLSSGARLQPEVSQV
jgi:asparagine synthase (glutamine-hydrolysing)